MAKKHTNHRLNRHRSFLLHGRVDGIGVRNLMPAFLPGIPWKFLWSHPHDAAGCRALCDRLLTGDTGAIHQAEHDGLVSGVEFHPGHPDSGKQTATVNIKTLSDTLLLRDSVDLPLWGRVRFVTNGSRLVPTEFIAAAAVALDEDGELDTSGTWRDATEADLDRMGLRPQDVTSGMYRNKPAGPSLHPHAADQAAIVSADPTAESAQYPEHEVVRVAKTNHTLLITRVDGPSPYFTKRVLRNSDAATIYLGTAWNLDGPWHDYVRHNGPLIAMGIQV